MVFINTVIIMIGILLILMRLNTLEEKLNKNLNDIRELLKNKP